MTKKSNSITLIFLCFILLAGPLVVIFMLYINKIHYVYMEDFVETNAIVCPIYSIQLNEKGLYIEGAIAQAGVAENYTRENKYLYFKNNNTGEMYETRVGEMEIGNQLTKYINDGNDYSLGGFSGRLDLNRLDISRNSYSIYCGIQSSGVTMIKDTHIDIKYGELDMGRKRRKR